VILAVGHGALSERRAAGEESSRHDEEQEPPWNRDGFRHDGHG
jgi:hypothetical protein